ncbi:hypothetical protein B0H16DRAFT_1460937 [Mycena metata]|uniref:Uncharacterized protein n=1 Tax=Mycena metata TaxID=1033252 RepID=A0AAD7N956_9AGAR|nr:hypothetical protein B0H16DRAFT_1460937 [Mycena metata]
MKKKVQEVEHPKKKVTGLSARTRRTVYGEHKHILRARILVRVTRLRPYLARVALHLVQNDGGMGLSTGEILRLNILEVRTGTESFFGFWRGFFVQMDLEVIKPSARSRRTVHGEYKLILRARILCKSSYFVQARVRNLVSGSRHARFEFFCQSARVGIKDMIIISTPTISTCSLTEADTATWLISLAAASFELKAVAIGHIGIRSDITSQS